MFVKVNNHTLHVHLAGDPSKPAVVLLHSLGTSAALWQYQIGEMACERFVICPDFRGHGFSEESAEALTCEALASDVLKVLECLAVEQFVLAGISLGGVVAQIVAAAARRRVTGLALFDSYIRSLDPEMWRNRALKIRRDGLLSIAPAILSLWMTDADAATDNGSGLRRMLEMASDEGYAAACDALALADCSLVSPTICCSTFVAYGSEDKAAPREASEALVSAIRDARLVEIADAGHLPLLHHAASCTDILKRLL